MIPPTPLMIQMITEVEAIAHKSGWDSLPPIIGCVVMDDSGVYTFPLPVQPSQIGDDIVDGIKKVSETLRDIRLRRGEEIPRKPLLGLCGVWLVCEAWANADLTIETGKVADHLDSAEVRQGFLLDFGGLLHGVIRQRGYQPDTHTFRADERVPNFDRGLVTAMRDLALEHAVLLPDDGADLAAISAWQEPSK